MEEVAWDRAVEQARAGESLCDVEALTLDGLVKCAHGKLPNSKVFALFSQLKRLSIANVGLSSLADFPSLPHLERLILSDNRIGGGLEHLVYAGLKSLRELDLSNNKIQAVEDLKPLAQLKLESLDLYECPVTRIADYRARVFGMMKSLRFLDKTDVTGNERPESDEEEEEEEEDVDDLNGDGLEVEGDEERLDGETKGAAVLKDDEEREDDEERDDEGDENEEFEDEEEDESGSYQEEGLAAASRREVVQGHVNNGHGSDEEEVEDEDDNVEAQDVEESEEDEIADEDDEDAVVDEEVEEDDEEPVRGAHVSTEGELDVHENEDEDEDENGELGEYEEDDEIEDDGVDNGEGEEEVEEEVEEEDDEEEEEYGTDYLVQSIGQPEEDEGASDFEPGDDEEEDEDIEDEDEDPVKEPVGLTQSRKRIREETDEEDRLAKH